MAASMWKVMRTINMTRISVFPNVFNCRNCIKRHSSSQTLESRTENVISDKPNANNTELNPYTDLDTGETKTEEDVEPEPKKSFATLFRNSPFVQLGDLRDKVVIGIINSVVGDDLYIDFGGKFMCVCQRPSYKAEDYVRGKRVRLYLQSFEMASKFMGSNKAVTLLEADCTLLGLFDPMPREKLSTSQESQSTGQDGATEKSTGRDGATDRQKQVLRMEASDRMNFDVDDIFSAEQDEDVEEYYEVLTKLDKLQKINSDNVLFGNPSVQGDKSGGDEKK
ncbi:28S ribosomal protein S28, mitochondrial-like isoform X5 [Dreissena polymorpha]|uniref:28S ribosomal protein S28, mitochondrial n=1 Tax=Dreissena polymorpha TaxID=45954 RepID=A0A9D4S905_DREPO|nr:28S ribosomal protein S28, mitochondrial-like isoform X5 [Dreissena polymorpha]KAH3897074.1 hypothetical protein DPMN_021258 [Dreissena polymorpha]